MKYNQLGATGVHVSQLCFGTMSFGGDATLDQAQSMFHKCLDWGINFFDCADGYGRGKAETLLGSFMAEQRDRLVISTKCFNKMADDVNAGGGNRRHVVRAVENSLQRLKTDRIDILLMHRFDNTVPLEETLRALEQVVQDGKVLYLGASNYAAWQVMKALGISRGHGWSGFQVIQPMYSLVKRQAEVEIFPMALSENLGVMTYSPLGGGLLSGKYADKSADGRLVQNPDYALRYGEKWAHDASATFVAFARDHGFDPVSLAVSWAAQHQAVTCPIIGARNEDQLLSSLSSIKINMTPELYEQISDLSRTPPPATDRLEGQLKAK